MLAQVWSNMCVSFVVSGICLSAHKEKNQQPVCLFVFLAHFAVIHRRFFEEKQGSRAVSTPLAQKTASPPECSRALIGECLFLSQLADQNLSGTAR
ncbi:MAG: hypothetical protein Q8P67_22460 [archaeon]|nr:hypothetical protein [archaeon]